MNWRGKRYLQDELESHLHVEERRTFIGVYVQKTRSNIQRHVVFQRTHEPAPVHVEDCRLALFNNSCASIPQKEKNTNYTGRVECLSTEAFSYEPTKMPVDLLIRPLPNFIPQGPSRKRLKSGHDKKCEKCMVVENVLYTQPFWC